MATCHNCHAPWLQTDATSDNETHKYGYHFYPQCSGDYGYIQISSCLSYMKSQVGVNQSSVFITVQISMYKYQWIIILGVSNGILLFALVHLVSLSGGMPL